MVAAVILGVVAMGVVSVSNASLKNQSQTNATSTASILRKNFITLVELDTSWNLTVADTANTTLACLRAPYPPCTTDGLPGGPAITNAPIRLRDAANQIAFGYDPLASASNGFTMGGVACNSFAAGGSDACPFRLTFTWSAVCTPGNCTSPQIKVDGILNYAAATADKKIAFNSANYSFSMLRGSSSSGGSLKALSGHSVSPSLPADCLAPWMGNGFCSVPWKTDIVFTTPFSSPPQVIVTPEQASNQGGCVGNATDLVIAYPENITATGFRLRVAGSPMSGGACGPAADGLFSVARAGWIAVGN